MNLMRKWQNYTYTEREKVKSKETRVGRNHYLSVRKAVEKYLWFFNASSLKVIRIEENIVSTVLWLTNRREENWNLKKTYPRVCGDTCILRSCITSSLSLGFYWFGNRSGCRGNDGHHSLYRSGNKKCMRKEAKCMDLAGYNCDAQKKDRSPAGTENTAFKDDSSVDS